VGVSHTLSPAPAALILFNFDTDTHTPTSATVPGLAAIGFFGSAMLLLSIRKSRKV
jgi:hypothetical protein